MRGEAEGSLPALLHVTNMKTKLYQSIYIINILFSFYQHVWGDGIVKEEIPGCKCLRFRVFVSSKILSFENLMCQE